jgi:hypothetical protein
LGDVDFEGLRVRVDSSGNEITVKACLLGRVGMNIDLAEAAATANLDDSGPCVEKPLFTFAIAFLDDSAEVIDGVGRILNCQRAGSLVRRQAFLERELGILFLGSRTAYQGAIDRLLLEGTREGQVPGSKRLRRTQELLSGAQGNPKQQPSCFMENRFANTECQVRQKIHLRPRCGSSVQKWPHLLIHYAAFATSFRLRLSMRATT